MQISHILLNSAALFSNKSLTNNQSLQIQSQYLPNIESAFIPKQTSNTLATDQNWDLRQFPGANILATHELTKGKNTYVGIIDSGYYTGHDALDYSKIVIDSSFNQQGCNKTSQLGIHEHGHRVLGIIQKAAPETRIIPLNIRNCNIKSTLSERATSTVEEFANKYVKAIQQITTAARQDNHAQNPSLPFSLIINISNLIRFPNCPAALQHQINKSVLEENVQFIIAIGNHAHNGSVGFPVNCKNVIKVGANTVTGNAASFSNFGSEVDIYAPGEKVLTTNANNTLEKVSGTSYSAPLVAAAFALLQSYQIENKMPILNQSDVAKSVQQTTHWLNTCVIDKDECNKGVINTFEALHLIKSQNPNTTITAIMTSNGSKLLFNANTFALAFAIAQIIHL